MSKTWHALSQEEQIGRRDELINRAYRELGCPPCALQDLPPLMAEQVILWLATQAATYMASYDHFVAKNGDNLKLIDELIKLLYPHMSRPCTQCNEEYIFSGGA